MDPEALFMQLTFEELALLLRLLRATTLPGLPQEPLAHLTPEQVDVALTVAERSLRARRIIRVEEGQQRIDIDPVAIALLATCLKAQVALFVSTQTPDGITSVRCLYLTPQLAVEHSFPEDGLCAFLGTSEPSPMLPRLYEVMHLDGQDSPTVAEGRINEATLERAKACAQNGDSVALKVLLREAGLKQDTAQEFGSALLSPLRSSAVVKLIYDRSSGSETYARVAGFATIEGQRALWILTPQIDESARMISLEALTAADVKARLKNLVEANDIQST